jgi:hypothetical protein
MVNHAQRLFSWPSAMVQNQREHRNKAAILPAGSLDHFADQLEYLANGSAFLRAFVFHEEINAQGVSGKVD